MIVRPDGSGSRKAADAPPLVLSSLFFFGGETVDFHPTPRLFLCVWLGGGGREETGDFQGQKWLWVKTNGIPF